MASLDIQVKVGIKPINKPTDKVIFRVGDMEISKSAQEVVKQLLAPIFDTNGAALPPAAAASPAPLVQTPAIGTKVGSGIYAGLTLLGERPARLILLPGDEKMNWKDAGAWAAKQGGELPSRIDALVLFQNLKKEFKEEYYWTNAQYADYASYAWIQSFDDGDQYHDHKDYGCRVRAVRKELIQ